VRDWKELVFIASVVVAYTLGSIINSVVSRIINPIEDRVIYKNEKPSIMRAAILAQNPQAFDPVLKNFEYSRLLRSTIFNFLLIGIFSFIHLCLKDASSSKLLLVVLFTLIATGIAYWAWYETAENYYCHLEATYKALKGADRNC
jgi:large-conductance mechanosensitive channel